MVRCNCVPNCVEIVDHIVDVNCGPLSDVMSSGTPKRAIHELTNALAHSDVVVLRKGIASGHLVVLSTMVSRWVNPDDGGRGPTMSIWI